MLNFCMNCKDNHLGGNSSTYCGCQCHLGYVPQAQITSDITCPHCHMRITYRDLHQTIPSGNSPQETGQ